MSTKSRSSSSNTTQTEQVDRRIAADSSLVATDGAAISVDIEDISPQALEELAEFGEEVLGLAASSAAEALEFAETAQKESFRLSEASLDRAFDATDAAAPDVMRDLFKVGAITAAGIAGIKFAPQILRAFK